MIPRNSLFQRPLNVFQSQIKRSRGGYSHWRLLPTVFSERERQKFRHRLLPKKKTRIGVVGAPLVYGQPLVGTDATPGLLRESGLINRLRLRGADVVDYGDLEFEIVPDDKDIVRDVKYSRTVGKAAEKICGKVRQVVRDNRLCLLLGGDHSVSIGSVAGHISEKPDSVLIWVDAHTDINTPVTSESGNVHGMVLGFLMKELHDKCLPLPGLDWCKPCISAKQVAYIGIRSVDPGEDGVRPLHLSLDVDCIDPMHIPATGTPVPGGLSVREALKIARTIHKTGRLSMMDVTELNPLLCSRDDASWSAEIVLELILRTFLRKQWKPESHKPRRNLFPRFSISY